MDLEADKKYVLRLINRTRKEGGLGKLNKIKRGIPRHPTACPLEVSVEGCPDGPKYTRWTTEDWEVIRRLIKAIDTGRCPELEIPKTVPMMKKHGERKRTPIL